MYRPENWERNPCDGCPQKVEDIYGLFCDLACGKHSAYINKEAGADAMYGSIMDTLNLEDKIWLHLKLTGQRWSVNLVKEESNGGS